jgi:hypothetical protein
MPRAWRVQRFKRIPKMNKEAPMKVVRKDGRNVNWMKIKCEGLE